MAKAKTKGAKATTHPEDALPRAYRIGVVYVVQICKHTYAVSRAGRWLVQADTGERWRHQWFVKNGYTQIDLGELAEL